ncbi:MAG: hypothetical protein IPH04_01300 [Saprospirales bacterium]|nr:hypothetical protein [Saprospirales bacterium]
MEPSLGTNPKTLFRRPDGFGVGPEHSGRNKDALLLKRQYEEGKNISEKGRIAFCGVEPDSGAGFTMQ